MKEISLTLGEVTKVDDEDFEYLNKWKWHTAKGCKTNYAARRLPINQGGKIVRMHRVLLGLINPKELCDHIDMDGLNNQKSNLRKATPQQNLRNKPGKAGYSSKYKGVYVRRVWSMYNGKRYEYTYWTAGITIGRKEKCLGYFKLDNEGEILAAKTYDIAAKKYFKNFAVLNF